MRAMKNMGISDLRLVDPVAFEPTDLLHIAHRCDDIIAQMRIYAELPTALADTIFVVGTAAIAHHKRPITQDVRSLATSLIGRAAEGRVALLFGQEDDGLDNAALDCCHLLAMLPSNPDYPALNLAQSVLLFLYELRMAAIAPPTLSPTSVAEPATHAALEQFYQLSESLLDDIDFFRYKPEYVMRTIRQITYRAAMSNDELNLLMAILYKARKRK